MFRLVTTCFIFLLMICQQGRSEQSCPFGEGSIKDLFLPEAELFALENNNNIHVFLQNANTGYYQSQGAIGRWLPQVTVFGEIFKQPYLTPFFKINDDGTTRPIFKYGAFENSQLSFLQSVFDPNIYYDIQGTKATFWLLRAQLKSTISDVLFRVRTGYYNIVFNELQVKTEQEHVALLQEELNRERRRLEIGSSILYEVTRSEVAVANALNALYRAQRELQNARHLFLAQLGLDPTICFHLAENEFPLQQIEELKNKFGKFTGETCPMPLFDAMEIEKWQTMALNFNPDLETQAWVYKFDVIQKNRALANYAPSVDLFADFNNLGGRFIPPKSYWQFGVEASWTLFDGFFRENNVRAARSQVSSAQAQYEEVLLQTKVGISDSLSTIEEAIQAYESSKVGVRSAELSVKLIEHKVKVGTATPLDYRDAVNSLLVARQDYNRSMFAIMSAYFNLLRVSGADAMRMVECCSKALEFGTFNRYCIPGFNEKPSEDL